MVKCEKRFKNFKLAAVKGELDENNDRKESLAAAADGINKESGGIAEGDTEFPSTGIDLKIDKLQSSSLNAVAAHENGGGGEAEANNLTEDLGTDGKKAKAKKVEEVLINEISRDRWRRHPPFSGTRRLSLRDPLELALTFSKSPIFVDTIDLCNTVNSLDLSNMKITKLDGIEQMLNLTCITDNQFIGLIFCGRLQAFPKLMVLDLSNNPISESDDYRKKVLQRCPALLVIDCEIVPKDERSMVIRKQGKALTIDFIEKAFPNFEILKILNLRGNDFQMIALDRSAVSKLQQLTEIDLSENLLENLYELIDLQNLEILNLSKNSIITLTGTPILPALSELNLSHNNLTHQMISRMGLNLLTNLKKLILSGNHINKFDMILFDLPRLVELDLSNNEIKSIRKKALPQLNWLNLADNKMKDLEGLATPCLEFLDISNNRIVTCSALKSISQMYKLKKLNCQGNPVIERRVYHEFVKTQVKTLEILDNEAMVRNISDATPASSSDQLYRRLSTVQPKSLPNGSNNGNNINNGITIRDQNTFESNVNVKWQNQQQSSNLKEPIFQQGKRPIYLPPRSNLVVNQRINKALSYKNFFPEG
uniref:Uncharacterized protein n=1 Tax=Panagrolaimus superbus TaxID=310955 RepID=A0A914Y7V9_9BILA